jgi:hypothetical protein
MHVSILVTLLATPERFGTGASLQTDRDFRMTKKARAGHFPDVLQIRHAFCVRGYRRGSHRAEKIRQNVTWRTVK